eukprot:1729725-Rhodomonas_salina.2
MAQGFRISLRARYGMCGTELAYGVGRRSVRRQRTCTAPLMVLPYPPTRPYAISGTDVQYATTSLRARPPALAVRAPLSATHALRHVRKSSIAVRLLLPTTRPPSPVSALTWQPAE